MAWKNKGASKSGSTTDLDVAALLKNPVKLAAMLAALQGKGGDSKRPVGRPRKGDDGPVADDFSIDPGDKDGYVNIHFSLNGESCKPNAETRKLLGEHGFRFAEIEGDKRFYGFARMVPLDLASVVDFEYPEPS